MQPLRDRQLGLALGAAPFFWLIWFWFRAPVPDLCWPLVEPVRFLMPALIYPVLEEVTFRGLLQPALFKRPWGCVFHGGVSGANLACSVLFAVSHMVWHSGLQALAVIVPSLIFGYFRDRYGRIAPSVGLHVFYNSGFVWLFVGR